MAEETYLDRLKVERDELKDKLDSKLDRVEFEYRPRHFNRWHGDGSTPSTKKFERCGTLPSVL